MAGALTVTPTRLSSGASCLLQLASPDGGVPTLRVTGDGVRAACLTTWEVASGADRVHDVRRLADTDHVVRIARVPGRHSRLLCRHIPDPRGSG